MVKRLVEFPMADGSTVLMEVDEPGPSGGPTYRSMKPAEIVEKAHLSYDQAIDRIKPAAESIVNRLISLEHRPDEIEIEFGIKLSSELGAFIASANAEVNFIVRLVWRHGESEGSLGNEQ